jgi:hypothetical protein
MVTARNPVTRNMTLASRIARKKRGKAGFLPGIAIPPERLL